MYAYRTALGPVELSFTDRLGGVSGVPFDSLNLALEGDDDPQACARNLRIVLDDFAPGDRLADLHQVHGCEVAIPGEGAGEGVRPDADGIVTDAPGVTLMVRAADCVPVLLADPAAGVVGAAHAGRPGLAAGVVPATLARMCELGASEVTAWVGPHVCGACYEVPAEMRDEVGTVVPEAVATTSWGTPSLDLGAGVRAQLEAGGVTVVDAARCTRESADLYSYRRDGRKAGRQAGLVRLRP
ncbi:peptidoglycan editing factor PgeF [Nocardioides sp. cx-173]|uniref:peptidoglycan editing factor PgeF n=1 Tax=Nocardioides sp. cx-173 TaxID=2898796 RepID=UPI001E58AB0E|nr:peptidoglycan editing factor PgeF [Nocardioides sp. cx-173]MCD4526347.1 peptidoglycan editing factor PgeF [Nocardioides sp. cx-173]UGB43521.1 peptidoglycan editing factor PgeF [Nocardioides sp. cx-173]